MKDAHKKFIEEIKALSATGKESLNGELKNVVGKCFTASKGNPRALVAILAKAQPIADAKAKVVAIANLKKSHALSMNFAKEKMNAVQPNGGPQ